MAETDNNKGFEYWKRVDGLNRLDSVKELAIQSGLDYVRIVNQRSDCRLPKCEDVLIMAQYLGVSMEYLLTGESEQMPALSPRVQALALKMEKLTDVQLDVIEAAIEASAKKDFLNTTGRNTI